MNYHGYIGLSDEDTLQWIFLNDRLIYYPLILKLIKVAFKKKLRLSVNQKSNWQDLRKKNMFILIFLTFSQKTFTFAVENEKRYAMFYDTQKILNNIRNSVFKCLAEQITNHTAIPYSHGKLARQITHLKSKRSAFRNDMNKRNKNLTPLMKQKNFMIDSKRRKAVSSIVPNHVHFDECHNKHNKIKSINHYIAKYTKKERYLLNSIEHQTENIFTKHTELYEKAFRDKIYNNVNKVQKSFANSIANNCMEFDKNYDKNHYNNSNNSVEISSPLSVWSNWSCYTNEKECNSSRNINDTFSKNNMHCQELFKYIKQFDFLPRKLCNLLRYRVKLTNIQCLNSPNNTISRK
jgi:DNA mismatch repair ATPase MutL